ncbi:hypothetical protein RJT34_30071 [Clitoria ternatea]|uniref:Uncharacterized protein n=1 Tax=Clitoria ternatea TaxID=43366 RepID=A0AAN9ES28_CLITE
MTISEQICWVPLYADIALYLLMKFMSTLDDLVRRACADLYFELPYSVYISGVVPGILQCVHPEVGAVVCFLLICCRCMYLDYIVQEYSNIF